MVTPDVFCGALGARRNFVTALSWSFEAKEVTCLGLQLSERFEADECHEMSNFAVQVLEIVNCCKDTSWLKEVLKILLPTGSLFTSN